MEKPRHVSDNLEGLKERPLQIADESAVQESSLEEINESEIVWSKENIDQEFLNEINTFADDYLLENKIPLAARTDIDKDTNEPFLYLETENGINYQEFQIPLVPRQLMDWNFLKMDIKNVVELWRRTQKESNPHDDAVEPHQTAA